MTICETLGCPECSSMEAIYLGEMGNLIWLRCRHCGWEFCVDKPEQTEDDEQQQ